MPYFTVRRSRSAYALFLLGAVTTIALPGQTLTTLLNFDSTNGIGPNTALVQGIDGNLYGTTAEGGESGGNTGLGTVFSVTTGGTLTTLHVFLRPDGALPNGLILATNGIFYGTTLEGGTYLYGTIFKMRPTQGLTVLYDFCPQTPCTDGYNPNGVLVQNNQNFFGVMPNPLNSAPQGTIFEITSTGTFTTAHSFFPAEDTPCALIRATNDQLYGTTSGGGAYGRGTLFRMTPSGALTTLHSFDPTDGKGPCAFIQGTDGNFYGTAVSGTGCGGGGCGTIVKMTPNGALTTLHTFTGTDGDSSSGLIQATDGNFYGATQDGGASGYGTLFEITPHGTFTTLHDFDSTDGSFPGSLVQATDGNFYGATLLGGTCSVPGGCGTIFSLSVGLVSFVKTLPTSGKVGAAVIILGTNLTGATSVTFSGVAAIFTVVSASEITTTVPTGATTGKVQVVTPTSTLVSNVAFRVP